MTNVISENIVSQPIKNSDNADYKFLPPIPSKPPIIIKTEPVSVNSNPLSTTTNIKKPHKFIGSNTITPGERLYRQGIELLEKKERERRENMELLEKLEKMVHRPKISEFNFSQKKEEFLDSVKKSIEKKDEKISELKRQKEIQKSVTGQRIYDKAKKENNDNDVFARLYKNADDKKQEQEKRRKEKEEKEQLQLLPTPKITEMAKKITREGNVFDRLYQMGKKSSEIEIIKPRQRSKSVYSTRSTSPSLSIPESPSRPDSPMSTISEPPWATFSSSNIDLPMMSSELEEFISQSPFTLGEMLQQLREDVNIEEKREDVNIEEKKDISIENIVEIVNDEVLATNVDQKLQEQ